MKELKVSSFVYRMGSSGARQRVINLLRGVAQQAEHSCPAHGLGQACRHVNHGVGDISFPQPTASQKEYAFEMASSNIRYGRGVTREVGLDLKFMNASKVRISFSEDLNEIHL